MKPNSMSSSAAKTSAGMIVFLPAFVVMLLALYWLLEGEGEGDLYMSSFCIYRRVENIRIGEVADENRRALAHSRDGASLNLRVWWQYALGQPRDDRTGHVEILHRSCVS